MEAQKISEAALATFQKSPDTSLFTDLSLQIRIRKDPIWCMQERERSSIPIVHGTTSLASYTLNLERERESLPTLYNFYGITHDTQDFM